jgi:hypothetical protein
MISHLLRKWNYSQKSCVHGCRRASFINGVHCLQDIGVVLFFMLSNVIPSTNHFGIQTLVSCSADNAVILDLFDWGLNIDLSNQCVNSAVDVALIAQMSLQSHAVIK